MSKTILSPDEASAHMLPSDLKKFEFGEHVAEAFSIAVGNPDETSVPLFTTTQAEAYADARVREVQQWLPIDTAPKDGSRVILAWGGKSMSGFFLDNSRSPNPWAGWRTESMVPMPAGQPSHWMPLPAPPQQ